ncbi:MAG: hypothetical protein ACYCUZ_01090 [Cuniculiplasma sp.]
MESDGQDYKNRYIHRYKTGRILILASIPPFFIFLGYVFYYINVNLSAGPNAAQPSSSSYNFLLVLMEIYFPIVILGMMILIVSGLYLMISSIEKFIGKSKNQITSMEYRNAVREFKIFMKKKSEVKGNYDTDPNGFTEEVMDSTDENTSPFSKK